MNDSVYNSAQPPMNKLRSRFLRALLCCVLTPVCSYPSVAASDWSAEERQLAQKIAAVTGPGAISLHIVNRSSLSKTDVDGIRSGLLSNLGLAGLRCVNPDEAAATAEISLSENLRSYVWVAELRQGVAQPQIVMVSVPRGEAAGTILEPAVLLIRKIQLWSQDTQILDVGVIDSSPPAVVVLDPEKIAVYSLDNGRWQREQSFPLPHSHPWPRDLHGRMVLRKDHLFDAYLPGVFCSSTANPPLSVSCRESDDPWPLGTDTVSLSAFFSPTRNFFTGALAPGIGKQTMAPIFYSAAPIPRDKYVLWLLAGVDGQVHELDGMNEQVSRAGWGSDLASIKTSCGSGWQVLATSSTDGSMPEAVRAYEFADRDPHLASQAAEFNGPVMSLWTEASGRTAVVVSRNLETRKYEAFRLAITCSQ